MNLFYGTLRPVIVPLLLTCVCFILDDLLGSSLTHCSFSKCSTSVPSQPRGGTILDRIITNQSIFSPTTAWSCFTARRLFPFDSKFLPVLLTCHLSTWSKLDSVSFKSTKKHVQSRIRMIARILEFQSEPFGVFSKTGIYDRSNDACEMLSRHSGLFRHILRKILNEYSINNVKSARFDPHVKWIDCPSPSSTCSNPSNKKHGQSTTRCDIV